jgi:hypothetical protein
MTTGVNYLANHSGALQQSCLAAGALCTLGAVHPGRRYRAGIVAGNGSTVASLLRRSR